MSLLLDHHYATEIAVQLRRRGHDVDAAVERGWHGEDDDTLLTRCREEHRALLTNNVRDFIVLARRWATDGRRHSGLVFTSDSGLPRARRTIGRSVRKLEALLSGNPGEDAFVGRVHWL